MKHWESECGLKVEIFGSEHSWYHEESNLVVITLKTPKTEFMDIEEFDKLYAADESLRALYDASVQLELCGWCPKAYNNELSRYFDKCELARKEGVGGCHRCIACVFIKKVKSFEWFGHIEYRRRRS